MSLFHAVARNRGGVYFNLKSVLGGMMLLDDDCDEIFCNASHETSHYNSKDEIGKLDATKIVATVSTTTHSSNVTTTTTNNKKKETVEEIDVNNKKDYHVQDEVTK